MLHPGQQSPWTRLIERTRPEYARAFAADQGLAIQAEIDKLDRAILVGEMSEDPPGRDLPDRQTVILAAGGQPTAVTGEGKRSHPASGPLLECRRCMDIPKVSRDV